MPTTHGGSNSRLYNIWCLMRRRCEVPGSQDYSRYGGRGISVCDEWGDFAQFRKWADASGYSDSMTLDRIENSEGYEPSNCRWRTRVQQNRNRRNNLRYEWRGEMLMLSEISELTGVPHDLLRQRVRRDGMTIERAVEKPINRKA